MTKEQFMGHKDALCMIVSFDPKTGKSIYDTYNWSERDFWIETFKKDFPHMMHFSTLNKTAMEHRSRHFGVNKNTII